MNPGQIVAAIADDRGERDHLMKVLSGHLHDADAARYRREVFRGLDDPALFVVARHFSGHRCPNRDPERDLQRTGLVGESDRRQGSRHTRGRIRGQRRAGRVT